MFAGLQASRVGDELHVSSPDSTALRILRWIGIGFAFGEDGGKVDKILVGSATIDFAAPGGVPGSVTAPVTVVGAAFGDAVSIGSPVTVPANFILTGFVSAADTVTLKWTQFAGGAADPDGAGGVYRASVVKQVP
jgi:hypothetical protein